MSAQEWGELDAAVSHFESARLHADMEEAEQVGVDTDDALAGYSPTG
jgi:hypothetical protein